MIARTLPGHPDPASLGMYATGRVALAPPIEEATPRNIEELCEQFIAVCESAVDPFEIASALEFEGLNDQAVRKRYGVSDVFALAEEMYRRVPRRPAEPEPVPDPWPKSRTGPALHGLLYGLPTICFPAAAGLLVGQGVLSVLVVALLVSWALSQPLAYLGYAQLGRADQAHAAKLLLLGVSMGTAGVTLSMGATALTLHVQGTVWIFGIGIGVYMLGATALMVLGAERLLLLVLAPGVLGSAVFLALGRPPALEHAVWVALAATPLLALGLAIARTSRDARPLNQRGGAAGGTPLAAGAGLGRADLRGALSSAGFGLTAAGLLVFPVATGLSGHGGASSGALLASLPLALSMGGAEWVLISFRRRTQRLLRHTTEVRVFATRARLVLCAALLQYLTAVTLLTVAVLAVAAGTHLTQPHWADLPQITSYLLLGGAMFLALLLQAFGSRTFPLVACAVALAFEVASRGLGVSAQIVACTELLLVLAGYAGLVLGRAVRHAY
jgi:hypothetical protein